MRTLQITTTLFALTFLAAATAAGQVRVQQRVGEPYRYDNRNTHQAYTEHRRLSHDRRYPRLRLSAGARVYEPRYRDRRHLYTRRDNFPGISYEEYSRYGGPFPNAPRHYTRRYAPTSGFETDDFGLRD